MRLVLTLQGHFGDPQSRVIERVPYVLGRGTAADWQIEDPNHHLSRRHCRIERDGSGYRIIDNGTNGTFINGSENRLGEGNQHKLEDGDSFRIGDCTITVTLEVPVSKNVEPDRAADPAPGWYDPVDEAGDDRPSKPPSHNAIFDGTWVGEKPVGPANHPTEQVRRPARSPFVSQPEHQPVSLEDPFGLIKPDRDPEPDPLPGPPPELPPAPLPDTPPFDPARSAAQELPNAPPSVATTVDDAESTLTAAFLRGAGINMSVVSEEQMEDVGRQFRRLVAGLVSLLQARADVKNVARVERTTLGSIDNNPLKFSPTIDEAILALLTPRGDGWLAPERAIDEGFRDIQTHELAMLEGVQVATRALVDRFDPTRFEARLRSENVFVRLVSGGERARCWELYKERYQELARDAENRFLGDVGADFSRAYDERSGRS